MDQAIRNKLRNVVTQCRKLLEDSTAQALQGRFGIYAARRKGEVQVEDESRMAHLTDEDRACRQDLLDHLEHIQAIGYKPSEALEQLIREIAFTHLNRLCAYKMMEARGLIREAVSRGLKSQGFFFYLSDHPEDEKLHNGGRQEAAYRNFLNWLGGTLSQEIGVLFNPNDPANRIYPPQRVLDDVLALINDAELNGIWSQDETIGWVYQYFTPKELRDKARKESQAPRNSYELAFRNQFFTPRYVVEFLTDNTLGRIWYEMRQGKTALKDRCRYLVRRPTEVFLAEGEEPPAEAKETRDDLSQEELLKQPVHIPHRPKKDPREIKVLDPACGSGHFLLYCFDLLQVIYEEAFDDPGLGAALRKDYPALEDLRRDVPGLILKHNLHGIDIDLRATQIAALALWLRCQRAYLELGLKNGERPKITRSNIVCAEPMPGETDLLKEFTATLQPKVLGQLVEVVFEKMKLAGEAGSLLKIEEEIREASTAAKKEYQQELLRRKEQAGYLPSMAPPRERTLFDFFDMTDSEFLDRAEEEIVAALRQYAEKTANGKAFRRKLFAEDAARGFALIDLCRKRYDVVLMNPPFGECVEATKYYLSPHYPNAITDAGMMFVSRGTDLLCEQGLVGAITNRTCLATSQLEQWRREIPLGHAPVSVIADLGFGVLDTALVEAAAYILRQSGSLGELTGLRLLDSRDKGADLLHLVGTTERCEYDVRAQRTQHALCLELPLAAIVYWAPIEMTRLLTRGKRLCDFEPAANDGGHTGDDFRFVRATWEIPAEWIGQDRRYAIFAKGGEYAPFWDDLHLVVKWEGNGTEIRQIPGARVYHEDLHFKPGLTYPLRTTSDFSPRILPAGVMFSTGGHGIHFHDINDALVFLSLAYTRFVKVLIEVLFGSGDASVSGSAARNYTAGTMSQLPHPTVADKGRYVQRAIRLARLFRVEHDIDETSRTFCALPVSARALSIKNDLGEGVVTRLTRLAEISSLMQSLEDESAEAFGVHCKVEDVLNSIYGTHPCSYPERDVTAELPGLLELTVSELMDAAAASTGGRNRSITKKSFFVDRQIDLCAHALQAHPHSICRTWCQLKTVPSSLATESVSSILSIAFGTVFGRWDIRVLCQQERGISTTEDPFEYLLRCSPAMLIDSAGLPAREMPAGYGLDVDWDGILVDDLEHEDDIVRRVREVLEVIWKDRAEAIEKEACEILGVRELRDYFRKPGNGGFWMDHVKRYSKSRRKAPIYWYLRSAKGNYGLWLYYHRLDKDILFKALLNYVEPKIRLEEYRLNSLRARKEKTGSSGREAKQIEKDMDRQGQFVSELRDFADNLRRAANLHLTPDLNDGVVLNVASLWELAPWKEAKQYWEELIEGKYEWSSIGKQLREKGIVKV